jgi:hypothetical protein
LTRFKAAEQFAALPENVNYAVKGSLLLSLLESAPDVSPKLRIPNARER